MRGTEETNIMEKKAREAQEEGAEGTVKKPLYVNTCVFGTEKMDRVQHYAEAFGDQIGFEVLPMFDLPVFEGKLEKCMPLLGKKRISFHEPVFEAEHTALRGTPEYDLTMWHIRKTLDFARRLHSSHLTYHLNNCAVPSENKERMLQVSLENLDEIRALFEPIGCKVFVENTGTIVQGNMLLDQDEFTQLCRKEQFDVLIDIGHANANGWDLERLIDDLADQIRAYHLHNNDGCHDQHRRLHDGTIDFDRLYRKMAERTPEAEMVIEYVRPDMEGEGLDVDIREMLSKME